MKSILMFAASITLIAGFVFAQTTREQTPNSAWSQGHIKQSQQYDPKTRPPVELPEAYALALNTLGAETNHFYCISTTCTEVLPNFTAGRAHEGKGWSFTFSNANGAQKRVFVYFDKAAEIGRDPRGF